MRLIICLIPLLCGCSTPTVRCTAHLQPINAAAAGDSTGGVQSSPARRAP